MKTKVGALLPAVLIASTFQGSAASSESYLLEAGVVSTSGGVKSSSAYSAIVQVKTKGFSVAVGTSSAYSKLPLVGSSEAQSKIADWNLY